MAEHKRSPISVDQGGLTSLAQKRQKPDLTISTKVPFFSFSLIFNNFDGMKMELA